MAGAESCVAAANRLSLLPCRKERCITSDSRGPEKAVDHLWVNILLPRGNSFHQDRTHKTHHGWQDPASSVMTSAMPASSGKGTSCSGSTCEAERTFQGGMLPKHHFQMPRLLDPAREGWPGQREQAAKRSLDGRRVWGLISVLGREKRLIWPSSQKTQCWKC